MTPTLHYIRTETEGKRRTNGLLGSHADFNLPCLQHFATEIDNTPKIRLIALEIVLCPY